MGRDALRKLHGVEFSAKAVKQSMIANRTGDNEVVDEANTIQRRAMMLKELLRRAQMTARGALMTDNRRQRVGFVRGVVFILIFKLFSICVEHWRGYSYIIILIYF